MITASLKGPSIRGFVIASLSIMGFVCMLCLFVLAFSTDKEISFSLVVIMIVTVFCGLGAIIGEAFLHKRLLVVDDKGIQFITAFRSRLLPWSKIERIHRKVTSVLLGGGDLFFYRENALALQVLDQRRKLHDIVIFLGPDKVDLVLLASVDDAIEHYHPRGYSPYVDALHPYQWGLIVAMLLTLVVAVVYIAVYRRDELRAVWSIIS